jgi:hypothetical protein
MLSSELGNQYPTTRVSHAGRRRRGGLVACGARGPRREAARSDCSNLRIDLERDAVASGLGVALVSKPSCEVKS